MAGSYLSLFYLLCHGCGVELGRAVPTAENPEDHMAQSGLQVSV